VRAADAQGGCGWMVGGWGGVQPGWWEACPTGEGWGVVPVRPAQTRACECADGCARMSCIRARTPLMDMPASGDGGVAVAQPHQPLLGCDRIPLGFGHALQQLQCLVLRSGRLNALQPRPCSPHTHHVAIAQPHRGHHHPQWCAGACCHATRLHFCSPLPPRDRCGRAEGLKPACGCNLSGS